MSDAGSHKPGAANSPDPEHAALPRPADGHELRKVMQTKRKRAPFLLYRDDSGAERVCALESNRAVTIGRGEEADLCLAWDPSVSSLHAEASRLGTYCLISDEGVSRNGTFVNNERLRGRRRLRHGDVIRVGRTTLTFNDAGTERRAATTVIDAPRAIGTVTLLFTDLVGSTELMDRLGDETGDRLRRQHFAVLRQAASELGGQEVKNLGDGLMVAFASALGGVECAIRMQERIAAHGHEAGEQAMGLRIGLNAGEVIRDEEDYFGTPVVVAKRLCDRAASGQTLLSEVVRTLVGSRGEYRFVALGTLQLKGFVDPITAFELDWRGRGSMARSRTSGVSLKPR